MSKLLLFICFYLLSVELFAQSNCERNLNEARSDYSSGNLYAIPGKLADCLEDGFSKTEKINALRLLTLTYININQQEKAKNTFIKLLNIKTDYQVKENIDPSELYSLYRKIDTDVKYYIGISTGANLNSILVRQSNHTNPIESNHIANYTTEISSPQIGVQFLYPFFKNFLAGAEVQFQNQRFNYTEKNISISEDNFTTINYNGNNNGLNLNLNLRYMKDFYQWKPFVELGAVGRYNLSYFINEYLSDYELTVEDETIAEIDVLHRRSNFNIGLSANIGTMIKFGEYYGEIKFGVTNYFERHLNDLARESNSTYTIGNGMTLLEDDYTNIVYQLTFSFNFPFFNFQ